MYYSCKVCGEIIDSTASFCPNCGSPCVKAQADWIDISDDSNSHTTFVTDSKTDNTINILRIIIACILSVSAIVLILFILITRTNHSVPVITPITSSETDAAPSSEIVTATFSEIVAAPSAETVVSSEISSGSDDLEKDSSVYTDPDAPLTAQTTLIAPDDLNTYHEISFQSGRASSILAMVNELYHYEPERAFDGDTVTSWQEGNKKTDGQGEWLELSTPNPCQIKYITLYLGNWRDKKRYESNNRPTELQIDIGDETFSLQFDDVMKPHYVIFSKPIITSRIRFTFKKVKVGTNGDNDCCISEVRAFELP